MRISKLQVLQTITNEKHLKEINLTKKNFGHTVALVGRNGAGKSRVLELVEKYFQNIRIEHIQGKHITNIPEIINQNVLTIIEQAKLESLRFPENSSQGQHSRKTLSNLHLQLLTRFKQYGAAFIKVVDNDDLKNIKVSISNDKTLTFESILGNSHYDRLIQNPNLINLTNDQLLQQGFLINEFKAFNSNSTIQYLSKLADSILTDQVNLYLDQPENLEFINNEIKKNESFKLFNKFQEYVKKFLGKKFSYKQNKGGNVISSILHYDAKPFNIQHFSPGQKTLFAYAILFFYLDINSKTNIKDSIIIIDEPEKHLHPEAQIALLNAIQNIIRDSGQLWIATHSINILSHLDFTEILMVKDDEIIPPSRTTPGNSFVELMGIESHINGLLSFVNSISDWAYSNFMVQCFKEPDVIFCNDIDDPQFNIFKEKIISNKIISVLDYGAGKGRMGYTIAEDEIMQSKLLYSAFEPNKKHLKILKQIPNIQNLYQDVSLIPDDSFDCILLCNVLHEINPKYWMEVFTHSKRILKESGQLLIIEDKFLPKGETAHEFGYLILQVPHIKILFSLEENLLELKLRNESANERIVFVSVKKDEINVSKESIINSIEQLNNDSFEELKKLRNDVDDVNNGRMYANKTQLYINSQLALDSLKKLK